jgi:phospholipid/cholesterol/gamma-HCH transport system permease protein
VSVQEGEHGSAARLDVAAEAGTLTVKVAGDWHLEGGPPSAGDLGAKLAGSKRVRFDASGLGAWDSSLLSLLLQLEKACTAGRIEVDPSGLPKGVQSLLHLATAVPEKETSRGEKRASFLARLGETTIALAADATSIINFLGESVILWGRFLTGRARFRRSDLALNVQQAGAEALPIVGVINFLIGLILAFVGALQLQKFGAALYVADLVGIGMTREMAPLMTAIIMSGRTGAAYAAQLGTMTVNEEIDALRTFGIPPLDFLVLPRMLALMLMMPLLSLYAMGIGIVAGGLSAWGVMGITPTQYMGETQLAVDLTQIGIGVVKASVFGGLVAIAGCLRGMQSGRNAAAVGKAATSAVVTSILLIIVVDAVFNIVMQVLGI